jgi:hypothetical protein
MSKEDRIEELEGKITELEAEINYFLRPLLIETCNGLFKPSPQYAYSTPPGIMVWLKKSFRLEKDKVRKRYLVGLFERLKQEIKMDLSAVGELEVKPEPDLSGIFER